MPPKTLPGFRDFYPEQLAERAYIFETWRRVVLSSSLLGVAGYVQREGLVIHLVAQRLFDLSDRLHALATGARDLPDDRNQANFDGALARADAVKRSGNDQRPRLKLQPSRDFH